MKYCGQLECTIQAVRKWGDHSTC